jgi:hypothetical protein
MNSLSLRAGLSLALDTAHDDAAEDASEAPVTVVKGHTFEHVHALVAARAAAYLPDRVVRVADLRFTVEGHVALPGGAEYALNPWSQKQLASLVGVRWDRWFATSTAEERAEELTRRLSRQPGELKVRATREGAADADGIARAFLAPTAAPIDDARIFDRMRAMLRGLVDEYRFTAVVFSDSTTHYTATHVEARDVGGDLLHPGWHLRNSEVGATALSLDDHWLRLVCQNGLMVRVGGKRSLYRTHRAIDDDALAAALVIAVGRLPERWRVAEGWMVAARNVDVAHPDDAVAAVLGDSSDVPRAMLEEAQRTVLRDGDFTRFGVVQAITLVAHTKTSDRDVRFAMERLAGDYLAATVAA